MASGIINLSKSKSSGAYIEGKIEWQATKDTASNSSKNVVAKLYVRKGSTTGALTDPTYGTWVYSLIVNGSEVSGSVHCSVLDWVLVATNTISSISHNSDGTKKVAISGSVSAPSGTSFAGHTTSGSKTVDFDTIPRASAITSAAGTTLGNKCSVKWTPASASFRYKLKFSLGNWSYTTGAIHPNKTSEYTYSEYVIPLDVANNIPGRTGTMTVTLYTYSNSSATTQAGSESSTTFTVTVPETDETRPIVKSMSVSPVSTLNAPYNGLYIQGYSRVKAALEFEAKYNASVSATSITVEGVTYESPYESAILNQSGKVSVKATVKDSRGYYGTNYREIEVIPYSKPYVHAMSGQTSIIAGRCDASGVMTDSGTYLKIKAKAVCSKVMVNGVQNNYGKLKYRYRKEGGSYSAWQTILDVKADKSDDVITPPLLNGSLDIKTNYQVQLVVTDDFDESVLVTISVPSDDVYMDRPAGGKSMGLGGYSTGAGILDVYWKTKARGGLSLFDDTGSEIPLDSTMPIPRGQIAEGWNPDNLDGGIYVVAKSIGLKAGNTVIMYNGVLVQMMGDAGGNVKIQLALPVDEGRYPMYRICWYSTWSDWRSMKS